MLQNVYLKSNEISFEVKPLQNIPALEIREKNGKINLKGKIQKIILKLYINILQLYQNNIIKYVLKYC